MGRHLDSDPTHQQTVTIPRTPQFLALNSNKPFLVLGHLGLLIQQPLDPTQPTRWLTSVLKHLGPCNQGPQDPVPNISEMTLALGNPRPWLFPLAYWYQPVIPEPKLTNRPTSALRYLGLLSQPNQDPAQFINRSTPALGHLRTFSQLCQY